MKNILKAFKLYVLCVIVFSICWCIEWSVSWPSFAWIVPIFGVSLLFFLLRPEMHHLFFSLNGIIIGVVIGMDTFFGIDLMDTQGLPFVIEALVAGCFSAAIAYIGVSFIIAAILIASVFLFLLFVKLLNKIVGFGEDGQVFIEKMEYVVFGEGKKFKDNKKLNYLNDLMIEKGLYTIFLIKIVIVIPYAFLFILHWLFLFFKGVVGFIGLGGRSGGGGASASWISKGIRRLK